jgi:putative spermidine/putrescine transport system substrate-binding protein
MPGGETGEEAAQRFRAATEGKTFDRRVFLAMCAAVGIDAATARLTPASADEKELVLVNFGGDAVMGMQKAFVEPYLAKFPGRKVVIDGSGASSAAIRLMVESGKITWDVMDRNLHTALELGRLGLLEKIDYTKVDRSKVRPEHSNDWGIGNYIYAHVMVYNTKKWGGDLPKTWAEVWDLKRFPGKRAFRRTIDGVLESALLADGVAPDKLYPIDMKRSLASLRKIKDDTIFYNSLADGQAAFRDGEADVGLLLNTRAQPLKRDTKGVVDYGWNQGFVWTATWMVPKGATGGGAIWDFIASTQAPEGQIELLKILGNGPVNPAASAMLGDDLKALDPGQPDNYARMIPGGVAWYAENATAATQDFLDAISS